MPYEKYFAAVSTLSQWDNFFFAFDGNIILIPPSRDGFGGEISVLKMPDTELAEVENMP